MKRICKIDSDFKFHTKSLFWSPISFSLQMINFGIKVYFPYFSVLFFCKREERELLGSGEERESGH